MPRTATMLQYMGSRGAVVNNAPAKANKVSRITPAQYKSPWVLYITAAPRINASVLRRFWAFFVKPQTPYLWTQGRGVAETLTFS